MTLHYAVINEQGCTFTVVLVQKTILDDRKLADEAIDWLQTRHFHMPTALMAHDLFGIPSCYYGPSDLALRLARIPLTSVPWQETSID